MSMTHWHGIYIFHSSNRNMNFEDKKLQRLKNKKSSTISLTTKELWFLLADLFYFLFSPKCTVTSLGSRFDNHRFWQVFSKKKKKTGLEWNIYIASRHKIFFQVFAKASKWAKIMCFISGNIQWWNIYIPSTLQFLFFVS